MYSKNQKGFTIIEVVLFLALSGLFLMIAFVGVRGRTENIQFTDSMRSLHSFLVTQQNMVSNGVNSSTVLPASCVNGSAGVGESNECILIGRVVSFGENLLNDPSVVEVNVMFGDKKSTAYNLSVVDAAKILDTGPMSDDTVNNYEIEWGTVFNQDESLNNPDGDPALKDIARVSRIGWFRSPDSSRVIPIVFAEGQDVNSTTITDLNNPYSSSAATTAIESLVDTRLCFTGVNSQVASINFDSNSHLTLVFDDAGCK